MAEHVFIIGNDFMTGLYSASCTCGWQGTGEYERRADAEDEWENHCDVVFMEATDA